MSETRLVDTNVLLRFFTGTPPDMAAKAKDLIAEADAGVITLEIIPLVLAETIYTLQSFYKMPKDDVCAQLSLFLTSRGISVRDELVMLDALQRYRSHTKLHFVDACLAAYAAFSNQPVHSFDSDFARFSDVVWKQ